MPYSDFTLENAVTKLGVRTRPATLFVQLPSVELPSWLAGMLGSAPPTVVLSEKARSEFLIAPVLSVVASVTTPRMVLYSGVRLDADPTVGLVGECDFLFALGPNIYPLEAPVITLVEAKKQDIEAGMGQCVAEMVGARKFNANAGLLADPVYGCVTTGEVWQFLRLQGSFIDIDVRRLFVADLQAIVATFVAILNDCDAAYRPQLNQLAKQAGL